MIIIPTSFDPIPWSFLIELLVPFIVFFGVMFALWLLFIPLVSCARIAIPLKKFLIISLGVISGVLWLVALKGLMGLETSKNEIEVLVESIFEVVNETSASLDRTGACVGASGEIDLGMLVEIEKEYYSYKPEVDYWYGVGYILLMVCYILFGVLFVFYLFITRSRCLNITVVTIVGLLITLLFLALVPVSSVLSSGLGIVCESGDMNATNTNINRVIGDFMGISGDICEEEEWSYLCHFQTCKPGELVFEDSRIDLLRQINATGMLPQTCRDELEVITTLLEETLSCEVVRGYYDTLVHDVLCYEVVLASRYTMWTVGLAVIVSFLLMDISFIRERGVRVDFINK